MVNTTKRLTTGEPAPADRFKMSRDEAETILTAFDMGLLHANDKRGFARLAFNIQAEPVDAEREDQERDDRFSPL
jgi:hypothetical protein